MSECVNIQELLFKLEIGIFAERAPVLTSQLNISSVVNIKASVWLMIITSFAASLKT